MRMRIIFTEEQEKFIISEHLSGKSPRKIGKIFHVGFETIKNVLVKNNSYVNRAKDCFKRKYHLNKHFFDKINTEKKAYWLGFIAADGCVIDKKHQLSICLHNRDKSTLERFKKHIKCNHPITDAGQNCLRVIITSRHFFEKLGLLGIVPRKTFILEFPKINSEFIPHFIRGYFDGDGCWYIAKKNYNSVEFSITSNATFLEQMQIILMDKCNLSKTKLKSKKGTEAKTLTYMGNIQCSRIYNYLYQNAKVFMKRKKNKVKKLLDRN